MPRETAAQRAEREQMEAAERAERERLTPPGDWRDQHVQEALRRVMLDLPAVGKDKQNTESPDQFWFRGIDAVVNAVGPLLRKHGVLCLPKVLKADIRPVSSDRGAAMVAWVRMRYTFHGPDGSTLRAEVVGEAMDTGDKAFSKAQSVAWRVALIQALSIPTGERDPDASSYRRTGEESQDPPANGQRQRGQQQGQRRGPVDPRQEWWDKIKKHAAQVGMSTDDVRRHFARWSGGRQIDERGMTVEILKRYYDEEISIEGGGPGADQPPIPPSAAADAELQAEREAAALLHDELGAQPTGEAYGNGDT